MAGAIIRFENIELQVEESVVHEWERPVIIAVLRKLACCVEHKARIGPELYELRARMKLNVSCEMVGFNNDGQVYLVQRPSCAESPHEPYPEKWHAPGSGTEPYEEWEDVFVRVAREFGEYIVLDHITHVEPVGYPPLTPAPPRATHLLQVFVAQIVGMPTNPRGRFFSRAEIPWSDLVACHKDIILPSALKWYDEVGFGVGSEVYDLEAIKEKH